MESNKGLFRGSRNFLDLFFFREGQMFTSISASFFLQLGFFVGNQPVNL